MRALRLIFLNTLTGAIGGAFIVDYLGPKNTMVDHPVLIFGLPC
jgi:hypothetical protein